MSVSFYGPEGKSLDLNNGLASRLLSAISPTLVGRKNPNAIEMPMSLPEARAGVAKAKVTLAGSNDFQYLLYLEELLNDIEAAGGTTLTWG